MKTRTFERRRWLLLVCLWQRAATDYIHFWVFLSRRGEGERMQLLCRNRENMDSALRTFKVKKGQKLDKTLAENLTLKYNLPQNCFMTERFLLLNSEGLTVNNQQLILWAFSLHGFSSNFINLRLSLFTGNQHLLAAGNNNFLFNW